MNCDKIDKDLKTLGDDLINLSKKYQGKYINVFLIFMEYGGLSTSIKYLIRKNDLVKSAEKRLFLKFNLA